MYFLRYQPLKEQLRTRTLSDKSALPYLIAFCGFAAAVTLFPNSNEYNIWDWISGGLSVALAIGGILYAYTKNGKKDGFDLIQKYVVIGWVTSVRCFLVFLPCGIALYFAVAPLGLIADATNWFDVLIFAAFEVIFYQRIGRHIADTK